MLFVPLVNYMFFFIGILVIKFVTDGNFFFFFEKDNQKIFKHDPCTHLTSLIFLKKNSIHFS